MPKALNISIDADFELMSRLPLIDVRSPGEYAKGRIPGAVNVPLFNDEERAVVGTLYKQKGKQAAITKGLDIVGPKMTQIARDILALANNGPVVIHCWRGGMRSGSVAWLMEVYGLTVYTVRAGYKAFRNLSTQVYAHKPWQALILGGKTGSAKTLVLEQLQANGQQVLNLEKLACHKGSAFGSLGEKAQPTQEQFENELIWWWKKADAGKPIWLEDESRMIGNKVIPEGLWNLMRQAHLIHVDLPLQERIDYLTKEYGAFEPHELQQAIERIGKRLGPQHMKEAISSLQNGNLRRTCEICLVYYDKSYGYGVAQRPPETVQHIHFEKIDPLYMASELVHASRHLLKDGND
ncbi:MAG: tRNA 2-selenouridine(34) synthase MnmH [Bacteroidetes bacterium]|nr:tRNA 2-selenouridine(34) synthase MnmH [Bacteroidota bacterium]